MPSTTWTAAVGASAVAVVAYAVVVAQRPLFGVFFAALIYLVGWLAVRISPGNPLADLSRRRGLATGVLVVAVLAYSVLIVTELLVGVLVAATIAVVSWTTTPGGPVARWLDARA
ncbi:MAG: hypothetical protein ABEJ82_01120 [Haloplanus sp.]